MNEESDLARLFYTRLFNEPNAGNVLAQFYCSYFEIPFEQSLAIIFNRLVRLYGKQIAYLALLEVTEWDLTDVTRPMKALNYAAKRLFTESLKGSESIDLTSVIKRTQENLSKKRKVNVNKISNPFEELNDGT